MPADTRITRAAARLAELKAREAALNRDLSLVESQIRDLEETELPAAFTEAGIHARVGARMDLEAGGFLRRKLEVTGSLPKEDPMRRKRGLDWARGAGYRDTIRCVVASSFTAGDEDKAQALYNRLRLDNSAHVSLTENIHHSTLQAIGRERAKQGLLTPFEDLGLTIVRKVELVLPRTSTTEPTDA